MPIPIPAIGSLPSIAAVKPFAPAGGAPGAFQSLLDGTIQALQSTGKEADTQVQKFVSGESEDLHNMALAAQKAEMAFDLSLQVRNKVVQAYQEIMKMQM